MRIPAADGSDVVVVLADTEDEYVFSDDDWDYYRLNDGPWPDVLTIRDPIAEMRGHFQRRRMLRRRERFDDEGWNSESETRAARRGRGARRETRRQ